MMALKTNKIFLSTALLCTVCVCSVKAADIETNTARMQAMDKITGKVSEIDVPVNSLVKFGSFSILVRKCITRTPEETPENTAFIDVVDDYNNKEPVNIFKGWMFSSTPALNAVEHPIYDVWLLKCYDKNNASVKLLSEEELKARDEIAMIRTEKKKGNDEISSVSDERPVRANSELDAVIKATIENDIISSNEQKNNVQSDVVEVVVTMPDTNDNKDEAAPQALIQIEQTTEQSAESTAKEINTKDATEETSSVEGEIVEFDDENGYAPEDEEFVDE
ncbi:MAG: DUF2155 domain-containing protein [Alphaproteobacteria bacterium]|nr:DUF2155 domain-containing protein [Alphaproteobacteria bacterium]